MLVVDMVHEWKSHTVGMVGVDPLYLRLSSESNNIWYVLSDDYKGQDAWVLVQGSEKLEAAWRDSRE